MTENKRQHQTFSFDDRFSLSHKISHIRQLFVYAFNCYSAYGGNNERGDGRDISSHPHHLAGPLPELEVRAGARQPAVEGGLQGYPDQRGGEFQQPRRQSHSGELRGIFLECLRTTRLTPARRM